MSIAVETSAHAGMPPKVSHVKKGLPAKAKSELVAPIDGEIVNRFDYTTITDTAVRGKVQKLATEIRQRMREEREASFHIGKALNEAKAEKKFGFFDRWVAVEFPSLEKRTYNHYMALAREFTATYGLVSYLPATSLYKLAEGKGTGKVRAKVIDAAKKGSPLAKGEVQRLIADAKKANAKGKPAPKIASEDEASVRMDAARAAVAMLREKLDDDFAKFATWFQDAGEAFTVAMQEAA
jgi:hypothetical protein